jgi:sulfopyruvate decarboxylase subunit alpha
MLTGEQCESLLGALGFTHAVWVPDSTTGMWEAALEGSPRMRLVRVCREGEAWALAAGLWMGGATPLVIIQNTGLLESGDTLRNVLFDLQAPLYATIGYRNYLTENSADTARRFTEPIVAAWNVSTILVASPADVPRWEQHVRDCRRDGVPGMALLAEGRG